MESMGNDRMYVSITEQYAETTDIGTKLKRVESDASTASGSLGAGSMDALSIDDITFDSDSGSTFDDTTDMLDEEPIAVDLDAFAAEKAEHDRLKSAGCYDAVFFENSSEFSKFCSEMAVFSNESD